MAGRQTPTSAPGEHTAVIDSSIFYAEVDTDGSAVKQVGTGTAEASEEVTTIESPEDRLHRTVAARRSTAGPRLPRPGACTYLIIDTNTLKEIPDSDTQTLNRFLAEIRLVSDVTDYDVSTQSGKVTIIGTAERAANSLLAIAISLQKTIPNIRILLGKGVIEHSGTDSFKVKGGPDEGTLHSWQTQQGNIYLRNELAASIMEPGSREGSHCEIRAKESGATGLMILERYKSRVERYTGGPDELIGYEKPLERLNELLRDDDTKLVFLRGQAGIGKSRILYEVLATLPAHILCSLDAADKNIPGASLVTLADQLAEIIKGDNTFSIDDNTHELARFSSKTRAEKIVYAQRNAKNLAELCFNALQLTTFITGQKSVFILEDLHNADRLSEPLLASIAQRYALETEGKSLVSMRPEEMYRSNAQDDLKGNVVKFCSNETVRDVELKGLNFSDEEISGRFAYHCIPMAKRGGKTVDQMGTWHEILGKAAGNSPFVMTSLMQAILEKEGALTTEGEIINVDRDLVESLGEISPDNPQALATHLHQRIANLSPNTRIALQAIALAGGRLIAKQIDQIIEKMVGSAPIQKVEVFSALTEGDFIHAAKDERDDGDYKIWKFQHEILIPFVISSITNQEERVNMSRYLYGILANDRHTHADTRLALLQGIVTGLEAPEPNDDIWASYKDTATEALRDARNHNNMGKAAAISKSILDKSQGSERIQATITDLKEGHEVPEALAKLAVESLMAAAESALYLGRFKEVVEYTEELIKIHGYNTELVDIDRIYLILFERAYLKRDKKDMVSIFTDYIKDVKSVPATTKIICTIKIAFRGAQFDTASGLFEKNKEALHSENERYKSKHEGMPSPDYIELLRLIHVRIPFASIRDKATKVDDRTSLDSDCLVQPDAISQAQKTKLEDEIIPALERISAITKVFPTILSSHSELALLDEIAEIESFRGNWDAADKAYKEAWRIADQMQGHNAAARIAKGRGDNLVTQALLASTDKTYTTTDIEKLKNSIAVYNREGTISIDQLESGNIWDLFLRINRIRAIGLLALRYQGETGKSVSASRMELAPYFEQAFRDFENINRHHVDKKDPEVAYYLLAPFNTILQSARVFGLTIPQDITDSEKYPYMDIKTCIDGLSHGANITDCGLNLKEATNKRNGLFQLLKGLIALRDRRLAKQE